MAVEVILPMLGETMDEATIVKWLVEVGQAVKKGEPIYQVETDKAVLEVDAPADGVLSQILYGAGSKIPVLAVVGMIATPGEAAATQPAAPVTVEQGPLTTSPISIVDRPVGAPAAVGQPAFVSPRARKLAALQGVDLTLLKGSGPAGRIVERDVQAHLAAQPAISAARIATTPAARKAAAEAGVELASLAGTGPGGRITRADIEAASARTASEGVPALQSVGSLLHPRSGRPPRPAKAVRPACLAGPQPIGSVPMTGVRRIIAERMSASAHTTARVTLTTDADATEFAQVRALLKDTLASQLGFTISYTDILVAIAARALREYPYMNARLVGEEIHLLSDVNVGVAVDTERGLLVPVIRAAADKGIAELARTLRELVERARTGKSLPDDLAGGTFTITNLGMYDIDAFTPIINLPECAILGVGRLREVPAIHQGQVCARTMMALSLTFDHRLVDGAPAARFLQRIKGLVEQPYLLLT
jgi:pyruvate dehydrogenase E2 component (dihydrolipoamide acetyltransferase)